MRRVLMAVLTGVLTVGCAGNDVTGPPSDPIPILGEIVGEPAIPLVSTSTTVVGTWRDAIDDAIERLVPALGPSGVALGAPLRAFRDAAGGKPDAQLLAATRKQFEAIAPKLTIDLIPDADAIRITFDALGALAGK